MTDTAPSFPTLLQRFFVDHLRQQRAVSPCTVAAYRDTFKLLLAFAEKEKVVAFVIGLPINMDGSAGPRAQATRAFVRSMSEKTELPFIYWDERLSTVAAERALIEADTSRKRRREVIDQVAAGYILQGALDRMSILRGPDV